MRGSCSYALLLAFATLIPGSASAQVTIHVPADQPSIQAGIDAAQNGDTVLVAPGTYHEHLDFHGKLITVASASGPDTTTIDGDQTATVVRFHTSETVAAVLHGFTIRNGKEAVSSFATSAGGISIVGSSPTIEGNVIVDNQGCSGAGIYISGGSPVIQNNVISRNKNTTCFGGTVGGGIGIYGGNNTQIIGNTITDNSTDMLGGGIGMFGAGTVRIERNYIARNTCSEGGGAGMVNDSSPIFVNNIIVANHAESGGGVYFLIPFGAKPVFLNNTFAENDSSSGSAMHAGPFDTVFVSNNILVAKSGQTAVVCEQFNATISPVFSYNDVYSSGGAAYSGICPDQTGQNGNISTDPHFANTPAGNYHLAMDSPVIDVANSSVPSLPTTDADGNPRLVAGSGGPALLDMGGYEYQGTTTMSVSATALSFSAQKTNTSSAALTVTVTNTGALPLHFAPIQNGADFQQTNDCERPNGLPAGQSCTIGVVFRPTTAGAKAETMVVKGANVQGSASVDLTGTGTAPVANLSTSSLTFAGQMLYTTSPAQQVTLTNIGDADLVVSSVAISGDFAQTNNCGTLAPSAACTISVTFTPTVTQARTGTITILDDAAGSPHLIGLIGTGIGPEISISPAPLYFLPQSLGTISNPLTVTVTNTGGYDLVISAVQISGDYSVQSNNCLATIAPSASCQVSIQFLPTTTGARLGSLTFSDNAAASPQTVALSGQGTAPMLQVQMGSPFPAAIYTATTSQRLVSLKNIGSEPLVISSITTTGSSFSQTNTCSAPLAVNSSCGVTITFTPQAAGTSTGTLQIISNAIGSPATLNLSATALAGYPVPTLTSISPTALQIGAGSTVLAVSGTNFYPATTILLDGQPLATTYVNSQQVTASLGASVVSDYGEHSISVSNPAPGGGLSTALSLLVYRALPISARDMVYDRFRDRFYATVTAGSPQDANKVVSIDPRTGSVTTLVDLGAEGNRLAVSEDGHFLWIGIDSTHVVKRLDLYSGQFDLTIPLGTSGFLGPYVAGTIFPLPGAPHSAAITLNVTTTTTPPDRLVIYDDGVPRANVGGGYPTYITTVSDPSVLYVGSSSVSPSTLNVFQLDASGLTLLQSKWDSGMNYVLSDGELLFSAGSVFDPVTLNRTGTFSFGPPAPSYMTSEYAERRTHRLYMVSEVFVNSAYQAAIWVGNTQTLATTGPVIVPTASVYNDYWNLTRWGIDGLAFRAYSGSSNLGGYSTNDQIVFLRTKLTNPTTGTNPVPAITSLSPSSVPMGSPNTVIAVTGTDFVPGATIYWNGQGRNTEYVDASHLRVFLPNTDFGSDSVAQVTVTNPPQGGGTSPVIQFGITNPTPAQLSATSLDFGSQFLWQHLGPSTVNITNPLAIPLNITSLSTTAGFTQSNDCGTALAAFATCTVNLRFTPTAAGPASGTLTVQYDILTSPSTVALSGIGMDLTLSLTRVTRVSRPASSHPPAGEAARLEVTLPADSVLQPSAGMTGGAPFQFDAATVDMIRRMLEIAAQIDAWQRFAQYEKWTPPPPGGTQ